jgi:allantoicase
MKPRIARMIDPDLLVDLASERIGGSVVAANDEFFAPRERLIAPDPPVFIPGKYTDRGKWMDGWETRRRREPGNDSHDWCLVRLGVRGLVRAVVVDTTHFKGNYPESCSIDAAAIEGYPSADDVIARAAWTSVLDRTPLKGDAENRFEVRRAAVATCVRLNIFPDGGVARLRVLGEVQPDWDALERNGGDIDLAAIDHGGLVVACSDMFFGSGQNLILPGPSRGMHDGWETRRRRGPGHDWIVVRLGRAGVVRRVEVDTSHFKGNAPGSCSLDGWHGDDALRPPEGADWRPLLAQTALQPHTRHLLEREIAGIDRVSHARLNIFPDGGVARLRVWGRIQP